MKVHLKAQAVQLWLAPAELATLLAGETIENVTGFGASGGWTMALSLHGGDAPVLLDGATFCRIVLPRQPVEALAPLPATEGLAFRIYLDDGNVIALQLGVDADGADQP